MRRRSLVDVKWFMKPTPAGASLDLPMSPQLEQLFRMLGLPGD